jgi:microcin C transport system permease protein
MSPRNLGITLTLFAAFSAVQRLAGLHVPVLKVPFLAGGVVGWFLVAVLAFVGVRLLIQRKREWQFSPLTLKQFKRFRSIKRGWVSFLILMGLVLFTALDGLVVGRKALAVKYEGLMWFPFLSESVVPGKTFGLDYDSETDYRALQKQFAAAGGGNWVILPPVPYATTQDSDEVRVNLETGPEGKLYAPGANVTFNGRAHSYFPGTTQKRREFTFRRGVKHGDMQGWDEKGELVERARYEHGERKSYTDYSNGAAAKLENIGTSALETVLYPPLPPSGLHRHWLGTNSSGFDILAMLFGGAQQAILAAVLYLAFTFALGIIIGGLTGYFGGLVDLLGQRVIEIWSSLPFLFVVMIVSSIVEPNLVILVGIIAVFGWMGTASLLRTATFREKARDYVNAAKLLGAGPGRVMFKHIIPNTIAILVTLAPFKVAGVITSLAALDFLGFGLPPESPSWGRLLHEGTENFNYPWIVSSAFLAMVTVLILITFVGEAVREAFDPKKFTTYE